MASRVVVEGRHTREPRSRVIEARPDKGQFFPGEVARMLNVPSLDYRQLRNIYRLVRLQAGHVERPREWARFSYDDIAAALEVVRICIESQGKDTKERFRLVLLRLDKACMNLREYGFTNPLLQVRLNLVNGQIVADLDGAQLDAETGQQIINMAALRVTNYFETTDIDAELLKLLASVRETHKQSLSSKPHVVFAVR